jgi:hypothetical protein
LTLWGSGGKYQENSGAMITFETKIRWFLGLAGIHIYIEDRRPGEEDGTSGKYKVFLTFRVLWVRKTFTFRIAYIGYFFGIDLYEAQRNDE